MNKISPLSQDDINFKDICSLILRQKIFIIVCSILGFGISGLVISTSKPVYQAEFDILIENSNTGGASSMFAGNSALLALGGLKANGTIATQIQILKSPSVLFSVFNTVKTQKSMLRPGKKFNFSKWIKSSLIVEEKIGTNIVKVQYKSTDKNEALSTSRLIADLYEDYSNKKKDKELKKATLYLEAEIEKSKVSANISSQKALNFGYTNGLGILDGLPIAGNVSGAVASVGQSSGFNPTNFTPATNLNSNSLEAIRTSTLQKIKSIEVQIDAFKKADKGSIYFASQLNSLNDKVSSFDRLSLIELKLAELKSRFTNSDDLIVKYEREKEALIDFINKQTISLLMGELELAKANLKALDKPLEILNKHRDLTQKAIREESTLVSLENQLKQLELEIAKRNSTWEIISEPILLDKPVAPDKKLIMIIGLLLGSSFGAAFGVLREKSSGQIFSSHKLLTTFNMVEHNHINCLYLKSKSLIISQLNSYIAAQARLGKKIKFISLQTLPSTIEYIESNTGCKTIEFNDKTFFESLNIEKDNGLEFILIFEAGSLTRDMLNKASQSMALFKNINLTILSIPRVEGIH